MHASPLRSLFAAATRNTPAFRGKGRVVLTVDKLLSSKGEHEAVGRVNGLADMNFDLRPWGQKFAYYYGEWEPEFIHLARLLYDGGAFVDVGSSLGLYTVCLGDLVRRAGAVIHSVEPISFNLERQRRNVALNHLEDLVRYHQIVLGSEPATVMLSVDPLGQDNNAFIADGGTVEVSVVTLDALLDSCEPCRVGFIKMDVEGFEPEVIAGARKTIARDAPVILAEFNRERMAINQFEIAPSWDFLADRGYRAHEVVDGKLRPLTQPGAVENIFFLPPGKTASARA